LDQFLWAKTNRRGDGYGGDAAADRVRFPAEVVAAIRAAVGPDFLMSIRLSQWKGADYDARIAEDPSELKVIIEALRAAGIDIFHISARRFWIPEWPGSDLGFAGWVKSMTDAPVVAVGSVGLDIDVMENLLEREAHSTGTRSFSELVRRFSRGDFDLIAVGRCQIADAQWVNKVRERRFSELRLFTRADSSREDDIVSF
jgi:2,4-dienoyl-CoA reductase-like NADH-dependent reductase (Old Yellow Enzyme family)